MSCPVCGHADIELCHVSLEGDEIVLRFWMACRTHGFKWRQGEKRRHANDLDRARWFRAERTRKAKGFAETEPDNPAPEYKTIESAACPP